jgi:O-antigen ligase
VKYVPGFILFIIVNAALFIRPSEIFPVVEGDHVYLVLILLCLVVASLHILDHLLERPLSTQPITLCVLGLLAATGLSHLAHLNLSEPALTGWLEFFKVVLYYLLLITIVNTPGRLRGFLLAFTAFAAVLTIVAVLQYHGAISLPQKMTLKEYLRDPVSGRLVLIPRLRGTGIFGDPNDLCLVLVVGIMLSLYGLSDSRLGGWRVLWVPALLLFAYALFLTKSRGGFLGLLVGLGAFLVTRFGWKRTLPLAGALLPILFVFFAGRQTQISVSGDTGQSRIQLWSDGLTYFRESPVFGIGLNEYAQRSGLVAHNSFLHAFAELGFFGGLLLLGAFGLAVWSIYRPGAGGRHIVDPELRRMRPYLLAAVAAYATGMMTLSVGTIAPTFTILGLATVYLRIGATHPPLPPLRFDLKLVRRLAGVSVLFMGGVYVFVRLFINWG